MALPSEVSRKLPRLLRIEIGAYTEYLQILQEQRNSVKGFHADKLKTLTAKRNELTRKLRDLHEERLTLLKDPTFGGETKLTSIVERFGSDEERRTFLPQIENLRRLVEATRQEASECQGVQSFALNVVNGSLSILMRATKHVSKQYGRQGKINESYLPRSSRHEGVLKQA